MEVINSIKEEEGFDECNVNSKNLTNDADITDIDKEKTPLNDDFEDSNNNETSNQNNIDYEDDSDDEFDVITKSNNTDTSPRNLFSIKTISNTQSHNNYKLSKTAIDLDHPGNINGVPTIEYDLSKLVDEFKPWKKPGADITDYFNYGFTEETWLLYCEKQKTLRLTQENSALKTLSGLQSFGYPLSGSHIHLGINRNSNKNKGGLIDVIGGQQTMEKNKHNDMGMGNKISTIPVQTSTMNPASNTGNYIGLANQTINNNILMSAAMAMGIIPPPAGNVPMMSSHHNAPIDGKMSQYNSIDGGSRAHHNYNGSQAGSWNNPHFERSNSVDSMRSHEDYGDRKNFPRSDRSARRVDRDENRRHKSRERREKSSERRRRTKSKSRDRERGYESRHAKKRNRSPDDSRKHGKHSRDYKSRSRDRLSSGSSRRHKYSSRKRDKSRSRSYDRKERHRRRRSPGEESDRADGTIENLKREAAE